MEKSQKQLNAVVTNIDKVIKIYSGGTECIQHIHDPDLELFHEVCYH